MEPWRYKPKGDTEQIELPSETNNLTSTVLHQSCPRLYQVEYPGFVENPDHAVRTLGGPHKVSQVRKLESPVKERIYET